MDSRAHRRESEPRDRELAEDTRRRFHESFRLHQDFCLRFVGSGRGLFTARRRPSGPRTATWRRTAVEASNKSPADALKAIREAYEAYREARFAAR
jgi:hypothetical protein